MSRKPEVIYCPRCRSLRVNRTHGKCSVCKVRLVYVGEFFTTEEDGFVWTGKEWKPCQEISVTC